jgi:hypothetical protein
MRRFLPLLLGACALAAPAMAAPISNPLVLELYTSQGCSSCPPADAYLGELKRERPDFLVLDFHIDYWDSLGWKDPFSLPQSTARQQSYDSLLNSEVYTPQLVVGGSRQAVGSDRDAVTAAVAAAYQDRAATAPVPLSLTAVGPDLVIDVGAGAGSSASLWLVGYDDRHTTNIGRGENGGLTETEVNIVRSIRPIGTWTGGSLHLSVPKPLGERAAVLLQGANGRILSAAALASAAS